MTGVYVAHHSGNRVDFSDERGGEAAALEIVGAGVAIKTDDVFFESGGRAGERAQAGLKRGHEQGGGNALSCYVRDGDYERLHAGRIRGAQECVIAIA